MLILLALALPFQVPPALSAPAGGDAARDQTPAEKTAEKPAETPAAPRVRPLLLRGATLHTMLPGDAPRVLDLVLADGRIRALGPEAASGTDLEVLDLTGKHVLPGLIDAHVNFDPDHDALYLAAGVTLVRDLGGDHFLLHRERFPESRERTPGPTLLSAGAALDGDPPASASAVVLRTADSAESYLPILFEEQVDFLSVLPGLPEEAWKKTIALAAARELAVFGPRPLHHTLAEALEAGMGGFHALDSLLPPGVHWEAAEAGAVDASIAALARSGKPLVPLLNASAVRLEDQGALPAWRALLGLLSPAYEAWWRAELAARAPFLDSEHRAPGERTLAQQARALRSLFDAGARLLPGSGAPQPWLMPGAALHAELTQWVRAGVPVPAVLELATREAAAALGLAGQRGTIEPGAWADLIVLDRDPSADLTHLFEPAIVIVRGRALTRADLEQRLAQVGARQAALRTELTRPVTVEAPPQAEQGVVILEGTVQSDSFGQRLSTERYRVVRIDPETLLFTTRVLHAPAPDGTARELTLEQFLRAGRLVQANATLKQGDSVLEHAALWTAGTWRMQSRLDGRILNTPAPLREQPACIDAGNVTALLILALNGTSESVPVVQLHPGFDAEPVYWRSELGDDGNWRVRTQLGYKAFRLDGIGALEWGLSKVGTGVVETRALSASAFGGPGLPLARPKPKEGEPAPAEAGSTPPKAGG